MLPTLVATVVVVSWESDDMAAEQMALIRAMLQQRGLPITTDNLNRASLALARGTQLEDGAPAAQPPAGGGGVARSVERTMGGTGRSAQPGPTAALPVPPAPAAPPGAGTAGADALPPDAASAVGADAAVGAVPPNAAPPVDLQTLMGGGVPATELGGVPTAPAQPNTLGQELARPQVHAPDATSEGAGDVLQALLLAALSGGGLGVLLRSLGASAPVANAVGSAAGPVFRRGALTRAAQSGAMPAATQRGSGLSSILQGRHMNRVRVPAGRRVVNE